MTATSSLHPDFLRAAIESAFFFAREAAREALYEKDVVRAVRANRAAAKALAALFRAPFSEDDACDALSVLESVRADRLAAATGITERATALLALDSVVDALHELPVEVESIEG